MRKRNNIPTLAVDLDGTLLEYSDFGNPLGKLIPGMKEELEKVKAAGWRIAIWTVRSNIEEIKVLLDENGIPYDGINEYDNEPEDSSRKMAARVYLDDRAILFNGKTEGLAEKIISFKPWYRRDDPDEFCSEPIDTETLDAILKW